MHFVKSKILWFYHNVAKDAKGQERNPSVSSAVFMVLTEWPGRVWKVPANR